MVAAEDLDLVEVAALVGDAARARMLAALMGGRSLTAKELAYCANVSRSTASGHLGKLVAARLLTVVRERRFSYYRIASPLVASMLESIKVVAAMDLPPGRQPKATSDDALRFARSCYDHLAGRVGVAVTDALVARGHIVLSDEGGEITPSGGRFLSAFGADLRPSTRRIFCQPCLDWSERRYHLKGLLGARILDRLLKLGWLRRVAGSRALQLTPSGMSGLSEVFEIRSARMARTHPVHGTARSRRVRRQRVWATSLSPFRQAVPWLNVRFWPKAGIREKTWCVPD